METNRHNIDYVPGSLGTSEVVLQHHGVLGMKWGKRKAGQSTSGRRIFRKKVVVKDVSVKDTPVKKPTHVNKIQREQMFRDEYLHRDKMTTKQIEARTKRIKAEQDFDAITNAPFKARAEAIEAARKKQARKKIKLAAAGLTVLGKTPIEELIPPKNKDGSIDVETQKMINGLRTGAEPLAKMLLELEKLNQSDNNMIYIPNSIGTSDAVLQHYGKLGMRWGTRRINKNMSANVQARDKFNAAVKSGNVKLAKKNLRKIKKTNKRIIKRYDKAISKEFDEGQAVNESITSITRRRRLRKFKRTRDIQSMARSAQGTTESNLKTSKAEYKALKKRVKAQKLKEKNKE